MRLALLVFVVACGSSKPPRDVGACRPFEHEGKPYYLCERGGVAAKPVEAERPWQSESERVVEAEAARDKAEREADEAVKLAAEVQERVEKLTYDLEQLDKRVTTAVDSVVAAQNDADRANAKAKLEELRREKAEMEAKIAAAKAAAAKAQRAKGRTISKECQDNPLAKGCS